ncbi:MAG: toprim domain-containing protein, partial [Ruminococcus flavefaciens]|nr:toprim domain-containing protein [Ruminococcus flavefaciens]
MSNLYKEDSIQSLSPLEFTRLRPGVYCGSTQYSTQLLIEIVSNAVDEWKSGHGSEIKINITKDNVITVEDNAQGFIVNSFREDGKSILEASFSVLNTSGKYSEDGVYEGVALGLNGIGSKLATYLSHWLNVTSYRDGEFESVKFKEGVFEKRENGKTEHHSGTVVTWSPSEEFFDNSNIDYTIINKLMQVIACLCPGLKIIFTREDETTIYYSENGLSDLVDAETRGKEILKHRFNYSFKEGKYQLDMVLTYTDDYSSTIVPYVNTGLTDSGAHITQIKSTLTREMNKFFKEKGWLKEKDTNLSGDDIQEGLYVIFNITAPGVSYDAQTKSRVVKIDMKSFIQPLSDELQLWFSSNEKELKAIADKALNARKAREAARKAREAARGVKSKKDKIIKFDSKLADCSSKDRKKCELYITEGDSASGNLKLARDNKFQAVLPIRGKILNVHKAGIDKIQKNAEIMTMLGAFGLSINPKTMKVDYDHSVLRYGKIIIESDADVDGEHIKNLFYTFIWNFCPQLIFDGYIYAGVPPLYRIIMNKKYIYLKDDAALLSFREENKERTYEVSRLKGLGEMSVDETEECLIDPDRRII